MAVSRVGTFSTTGRCRCGARGHLHRRRGEPAAPMSGCPTRHVVVSMSSRHASRSSFSMKGSPTCTFVLFSSVPSETPPKPCGAVDAVAPGLGAEVDHRVRRCRRGALEDAVPRAKPRRRVDQYVAVVALVEGHVAATVGTPRSCRSRRCPRPRRDQRLGARVIRAPERSESRARWARAHGNRRAMPHHAVAAPWYVSMNEGWLCDSILTHRLAVPMSTTPAFSPGPWIRAGRWWASPSVQREALRGSARLHITEKMPSSV